MASGKAYPRVCVPRARGRYGFVHDRRDRPGAPEPGAARLRRPGAVHRGRPRRVRARRGARGGAPHRGPRRAVAGALPGARDAVLGGRGGPGGQRRRRNPVPRARPLPAGRAGIPAGLGMARARGSRRCAPARPGRQRHPARLLPAVRHRYRAAAARRHLGALGGAGPRPHRHARPARAGFGRPGTRRAPRARPWPHRLPRPGPCGTGARGGRWRGVHLGGRALSGPRGHDGRSSPGRRGRRPGGRRRGVGRPRRAVPRGHAARDVPGRLDRGQP